MTDHNNDNQGGSATTSLPAAAVEFATRMFNAAREGEKDVFQQALPAGLPPNLTNDKGDSILMLAAYNGHVDLVRLLIQHGADPNRLNDRGQSPLAGAVFKKEDEVIEVLIEGGADPEYGAPSALECLSMFKQEDKWGEKFHTAIGREKAAKSGSRRIIL